MEYQFEEVLDRYLNKDFTSPADIEMQNGVIEIVERMHDKVVKFKGEKTRRNMGEVGGYVTTPCGAIERFK